MPGRTERTADALLYSLVRLHCTMGGRSHDSGRLLAVAVPLKPEVEEQDAAVKSAAKAAPVRLLPLAIHDAERNVLSGPGAAHKIGQLAVSALVLHRPSHSKSHKRTS